MPHFTTPYESAGAATMLGDAPTTAAATTSDQAAEPPTSDLTRAIAPPPGTAFPEFDGHYLVLLEDDANLASVRSLAESLGAKIRHEYTACLRGFAGSLSGVAAEILRRVAGVTLIADWGPCSAE